jgi:hypothetical protein
MRKKHKELICSYCGANIEDGIIQCPICLSMTIGVEAEDVDNDDEVEE